MISIHISKETALAAAKLAAFQNTSHDVILAKTINALSALLDDIGTEAGQAIQREAIRISTSPGLSTCIKISRAAWLRILSFCELIDETPEEIAAYFASLLPACLYSALDESGSISPQAADAIHRFENLP